MPDLTLGPMRVQGAAATLAKAAEKLGVPIPPSDDRVERVAIAIYSQGRATDWHHSLGEGVRQICRALARAAIAAYEAR